MQPRRDVGLAPLLPSHAKGASLVAVKLRSNGLVGGVGGVCIVGKGGFSLVF